MDVLTYLTFFSSLSFLFFGTACFIAIQMKLEFIRYGLANIRRVVGALELLGALGLVWGYFYNPMLHAFAAGGLTLLMLLGFGVRLRIRDGFFQSAPSLLYAVLNAVLLLLSVAAL